MQNLQSALHLFQVIAPFLVASFLPSLITGLSLFPKTSGIIRVIQKILDGLSFVTHLDSPGTFKLPIAQSSQSPQGK